MEPTRHGRATPTPRRASREEAVGRAEAYLRAHIDMPVALSDLCRVVGLSERGLRNAFYTVRGMSPKRSMLAERLRGVRRTLRNSDIHPTTVTAAATGYGFYELGRFAAAYREAFGETPSATLRARHRRPPAADATRKEHADACTT